MPHKMARITQGRLEDFEDALAMHDLDKIGAAHYRRLVIEAAVSAGIVSVETVGLRDGDPAEVKALAGEIVAAVNAAREQTLGE